MSDLIPHRKFDIELFESRTTQSLVPRDVLDAYLEKSRDDNLTIKTCQALASQEGIVHDWMQTNRHFLHVSQTFSEGGLFRKQTFKAKTTVISF